MIKQLGEKHNLPLKTGFNGTKGFFVQLTLNRDQHIDLKTLPGEFLKAVKVRSAVCFTTVDLVSKCMKLILNRKQLLCDRACSVFFCSSLILFLLVYFSVDTKTSLASENLKCVKSMIDMD